MIGERYAYEAYAFRCGVRGCEKRHQQSETAIACAAKHKSGATYAADEESRNVERRRRRHFAFVSRARGMKYKDIGRALGVSAPRARQIEFEFIRRIVPQNRRLMLAWQLARAS